MLKLKIPEMRCGHCAATIEKTIRGFDPAAQVEIDLTSKAVTIRSVAQAARLRDAVSAAGYENHLAGD